MPLDMRRETVKLGKLLSIAEQIQAFGLGRKTGEIHVTNSSVPARISLIDGEVVDAQYGQRTGMEAAIAIINLPDPQSEFVIDERAKQHSIAMPYLQLLCEAAARKDEAMNEAARRPTEPIRVAVSGPSLCVTLGSEIKTFAIRPGLAYIGRGAENDIVIDDSTVSHRHASIEYSREGVLLKDLGSTNKTCVAGKPIEEHWLKAQDGIQFGGVYCLFIGVQKKAKE
jgi:hypothetical protein